MNETQTKKPLDNEIPKVRQSVTKVAPKVKKRKGFDQYTGLSWNEDRAHEAFQRRNGRGDI